jgi:hypothetical protein
MGLDHADDDIDAVQLALARLREHLVGLADAGRGAEEDLELAAPSFLPASSASALRAMGVLKGARCRVIGHPGTLCRLAQGLRGLHAPRRAPC